MLYPCYIIDSNLIQVVICECFFKDKLANLVSSSREKHDFLVAFPEFFHMYENMHVLFKKNDSIYYTVCILPFFPLQG